MYVYNRSIYHTYVLYLQVGYYEQFSRKILRVNPICIEASLYVIYVYICVCNIVVLLCRWETDCSLLAENSSQTATSVYAYTHIYIYTYTHVHMQRWYERGPRLPF